MPAGARITEQETESLEGMVRVEVGNGPVPLNAQSIERVEVARQYLHEHAAEPVTLATLSRVAALSPFYLVRVFKAHVGVPPYRYLTSLRVARARTLLESSSLSVTQVAHRCGFGSASHFSTVFRSHTGLSPTEYRQRSLAALRETLPIVAPPAALA
jgi:transcriptional regulator GlxA family with amidase domain